MLAPLRQNATAEEASETGRRKEDVPEPGGDGPRGTQLGDTGTSVGWNTVDGLDEVKQPNLQTELLFVESEVLVGR